MYIQEVMCNLFFRLNAKSFVLTTYPREVLFCVGLKKSNIFTFSFLKKMTADNAEIGMVGILEADCSTSSVCLNFLKLSQYYCETSIIRNQ